ncbi:hypothetical protein ACI2OX_10535 [Bacillus sp. N9]
MFTICTFIIIVPVNFLHTIQSPDFTQYMGVERSDIRIDLQQSSHATQTFNEMVAYIEKDPDVQTYSPFISSQFKVVNDDGVEESMIVESGDFSLFPLEYLKGYAPRNDGEIALSYLNGKELQKQIGDRLLIFIDGKEKEMVVSGIYQDITNGGRTAKALLMNENTLLSYKLSIDFNLV